MDEQTGSEAQGLVRVKILHSSATDCYCYDRAMALERDDLVVVPTRYGSELGRVQGALSGKLPENRQPPQVTRRASETDLQRFESQRQREASAFLTCRQKIAEHGLDMKLVSAHYMMDEKKLLFYFTAESRVDFRQLVRDLVGVFKTRIELRQIGVRDEARVVGGAGVCGRTYCCHGVTDKLRAVSIKMAKEQSLTLNSMKISGPCGRLLCCLAYEYECYREMRRTLPQEGTRIRVDGGTFKVTDINVFARTVKLSGEGGSHMDLEFARFHYDTARQEWQVQQAL